MARHALAWLLALALSLATVPLSWEAPAADGPDAFVAADICASQHPDGGTGAPSGHHDCGHHCCVPAGHALVPADITIAPAEPTAAGAPSHAMLPARPAQAYSPRHARAPPAFLA